MSMFPASRKKTKVSDEVRFDKFSHWIIGLVKKNNDNVLNVRKQHYIFNAMLLYTQNVLRDPMNRDRLTK